MDLASSRRPSSLLSAPKKVKPRIQHHLYTATCGTINRKGAIPVFVHIGDLRVRFWLGFLEILAVDLLLRTVFIERCMMGLFKANKRLSARILALSLQSRLYSLGNHFILDSIFWTMRIDERCTRILPMPRHISTNDPTVYARAFPCYLESPWSHTIRVQLNCRWTLLLHDDEK